MKKMITKGMLALFIAIMMVSLIAMPVKAGTENETDWLAAIDGTSSGASEKAKNLAGQILSVVQVVGISVAVVVLIFVAIKYISAAPNDKAEIKKHMVVYVVGAIVLFAGTGILGIISEFAGIFDTPDTIGKKIAEIEAKITKLQAVVDDPNTPNVNEKTEADAEITKLEAEKAKLEARQEELQAQQGGAQGDQGDN